MPWEISNFYFIHMQKIKKKKRKKQGFNFNWFYPVGFEDFILWLHKLQYHLSFAENYLIFFLAFFFCPLSFIV